MTIKKIEAPKDSWFRRCRHPAHDPPNMIVLEPGTYEHECPSCHAKQIFQVREPPRLSFFKSTFHAAMPIFVHSPKITHEDPPAPPTRAAS
jgi:hypothetical protein